VGASGSYAVRVAVPTDLLAVVRLIDRVPPGTPSELTATQRATWSRMLATADLTVYVAERRGEVVGTTSLLLMPHLTYDCHPTGFVEPVVVSDAHRRRGVGRLMLERVLADAQRAGVRKLQVLSHKRHAGDGAHDFYRSLGFQAEAEGFRLYLGSGAAVPQEGSFTGTPAESP
jgi:GNAT superfamily N-acetyltransferase